MLLMVRNTSLIPRINLFLVYLHPAVLELTLQMLRRIYKCNIRGGETAFKLEIRQQSHWLSFYKAELVVIVISDETSQK